MAGSNRRFAVAAVLLPLLFLVMSGLARANNIAVNTIDGESDPFPLCSLPDAITAHNLQIPINGCVAGNGSDSIFFNVTGTIFIDETLEVTNGLLGIQGALFGCSGAGPCGITIDGESSVQIIKADPGTSVFLSALTLANGSAVEGGAIFANGTDLEIEDCLFRNNTALPTLIAGGMGGAIFGNSNGAITIVNSTFANNLAAHRGDPTVHNSGTDGFGGAIFYDTVSSVVKITNSTFAGNTADVGTYDGSPAASMKGTIFANNTGILINANCNGVPVDKNYNISDDASCAFVAAQSSNNTNPQLDPDGLENNGGPTDTIDLQPTSPAIDRIPVPCTDQELVPQPLGTDQRLFGRPDAANLNFCDSGALEVGALPPYTLNNERVQVARSADSANADKVNIGITFTANGDDTCDLGPFGDEDALHFGFGLTLVQGTCASLPASGLFLNLFPFVIHTVNHEEYGTLFQSSLTTMLQQPSETVSARLLALPTPPNACGEWVLNLEVSGLNTSALGLGGGNPFALLISDFTDATGCFDITNAVVGTQTPTPPPRGHRRRVRRSGR
jgi:hypothetical protein